MHTAFRHRLEEEGFDVIVAGRYLLSGINQHTGNRVRLATKGDRAYLVNLMGADWIDMYDDLRITEGDRWEVRYASQGVKVGVRRLPDALQPHDR